MIEVDAGWITQPVDLTDPMLATIPLTPRYDITEQHGQQQTKIRLIDYFRASAINAIIETNDTSIPDTIDVLIAVSFFSSYLHRVETFSAIAQVSLTHTNTSQF